MAHRYGTETPMDFSYDNGTGAIDARSPFANVQANAQRFPSSRKRNYDAFDSPSPQKSRHMGVSPSKPLPPAPPSAFNSLFTTPRKPRPEIDDSSAGETPRSPDKGDESEATPEIRNERSAMMLFDRATAPAVGGAERERGSPTKERPTPGRRDSLVWRLVKSTKKMCSPGRGEIPRSEHTGAIEKRTKKKHKRNADERRLRQRRHSMSDSGEEREPRRSKSPRKRSGQHPPPSEEKEPHWIGALFTFIGRHPTVPHILSYYAQFLFNVFLLGCCGYLIYCFWAAVQGDIDKKAAEAMADVLADMAKCAADYESNNCAPGKRVPKLEAYCEQMERCMARDATKIGRARVSATTFAEIYNSFIEPISWKAMVFTMLLVFGCFGISNMAFGFFRQKAQQYQPQPGYNYPWAPPPPPTPQRSFSGQDGQFYAGTPWHMPPQAMGLEPMPSGGFGQIEGQGSPVRRLMYSNSQ